jgi:predicted RNase H-like HicB family nuclease
MNITFETELETDGRWIAEVPELAGVMAYGATEMEAVGKAEALELRVLAERIEHGESRPMDVRIVIAAALTGFPQAKLNSFWQLC